MQAGKAQFEHELQVMIEEHISFPSIVMYVVFNEGWGQYETERVTRNARALDPSRLYNCASGWHAPARSLPVSGFAAQHKTLGMRALQQSGRKLEVRHVRNEREQICPVCHMRKTPGGDHSDVSSGRRQASRCRWCCCACLQALHLPSED